MNNQSKDIYFISMVYNDSLRKDHPSFLASAINSIIRLAIYYLASKIFGFGLGTGVTFFSFFVWRRLAGIIYGIEYLGYFDKFFINMDNRDSFNLGGILRLKNFKSENVKNAIVEKLFKRIPKLSASVRTLMSEYCWNTPQISLISADDRAQIYLKRIKEVNIKECELDDYVEREANKPLEVFDSPIEFHIISFTDNKEDGVLYSKVDHCFSDGLGNISVLGFLDDDFSLDKYPSILRRKVPFLQNILVTVKDFILGFFIGILEISYTSATLKSLYFTQPITTKKGKLGKIGNVNLDSIKKVSKKLKLSINEIYIGAIFASLKELDPTKEKISIMIPMGFTTLPESIDKIQLYNSASGFIGVVRLITDIVKDANIIKSDIRAMVTKLYKTRAFQINATFFFGLLNTRFIKSFMKPVELDCVITNVPGQEREIIIGGCKVVENYGAIVPSTNKCFINIGSYNGNVTVGIGIDENQKLSPKVLSALISSKLQKLIEENKTQ